MEGGRPHPQDRAEGRDPSAGGTPGTAAPRVPQTPAPAGQRNPFLLWQKGPPTSCKQRSCNKRGGFNNPRPRAPRWRQRGGTPARGRARGKDARGAGEGRVGARRDASARRRPCPKQQVGGGGGGSYLAPPRRLCGTGAAPAPLSPAGRRPPAPPCRARGGARSGVRRLRARSRGGGRPASRPPPPPASPSLLRSPPGSPRHRQPRRSQPPARQPRAGGRETGQARGPRERFFQPRERVRSPVYVPIGITYRDLTGLLGPGANYKERLIRKKAPVISSST